MQRYLNDSIDENRNVKFLFFCKFARLYDEKNYECHNHLEIDVLISGEGAYLIDGKTYTVKAGDVIVLNPGVYHKSLVTHPENPLVECFLGLTDASKEDQFSVPIRLQDLEPIMSVNGETKVKIFHLCNDILEEYVECRLGRMSMLNAYVRQLLILLFRQEENGCKPEGSNAYESIGKRYVVEQIILYLKDHYTDKISLELLAENIHLSSFYMSKIFKSETGDTPINYLINLRLEKAKMILESGTKESIQEVASCVGYDDVYHFSKLFKKKFGTSPSGMKR